MKKILVLSSGDFSRSHMAEGYFRCYAVGRAQFFSAAITPKGVHPLAIKAMAEDNIDISGIPSSSYRDFRYIRFDYLILLNDDHSDKVPSSVSARKVIHLNVNAPVASDAAASEKLDAFRRTRESLKKQILKFIGKELIAQTETVLP
jgi:arsenate reductase